MTLFFLLSLLFNLTAFAVASYYFYREVFPLFLYVLFASFVG